MRERELPGGAEGDSGAHPAQPWPAAGRRQAAFATVAAVLVVALGAALFASLATQRTARGAMGASPTRTPATATSPAATPTATRAPNPGTSPLQSPRRGAGLPAGVEVVAFAPTGPDDGWGTGCAGIDPVTGVPAAGMVLRYAGGAWSQVGPTLPGAYLGALDMLSSSEGWAIGGGDESGQHLLLHISNGSWQQVALPAVDPGAAPAVLAMRTADEGWLAMANVKSAQSGANTSLFHDVGGTWSLVPNPLKYIADIAPVADGEAWVIGSNTDGTSSLLHLQGGSAAVVLTSPRASTFSRLRVFAPNDIWIEGAVHAPSNADVDDKPLAYHFDGSTWSYVSLRAPAGAQHIGIVASQIAWSFASVEQPPPNETAFGQIASIFSNASGQWRALSVPYKDLQSLTVVSTSSTDVWAIGVYMVTTQTGMQGGGTSFASVSHSVLLRYVGGTWTEYGR